MSKIVYILCALTSLVCAILLGRGYLKSRTRLLLWSTLCFCLLTVNNILLYIDVVVLPGPTVDLRPIRGITYLLAMMILIFGLIWDSD